MEQILRLVSTDKFCSISNNKKYKTKETLKVKKVGPPTLVNINSNIFIAKEVKKNKKVGLSTLVNIIMLRIIIIILSMLSTHLIPPYCVPTTPPCCTRWSRPTTCQWPPSAWPPPSTQYRHRSGAQWSYSGMHANKLIKTINGNRRLGYNLSMWNCRRGLINTDKEPTTKMVEVKNVIQSRKLHMLCLVESDLHSAVSRYKRAQPLTTKDIKDKLGIPGYKIFLPETWDKHGQARIIIYTKEELQVKLLSTGNNISDLPSISFLISLGREKKTVVNFFYREFTGGVSGLDSIPAQNERLTRQINHWRNICGSKRDFVSLGDANLCSIKWHEDDYHLHDQAAMVQSFLLDTASSQLVKSFTRSEMVQGGTLSPSCIDHCYSNVPEKLSTPEVIAVGDSDHLGIVITKYTRAEPLKPRTVTKRSYKKFEIEKFLTDVLNSDIDKDVTACDNVEEAAEAFEKSFKPILDRHAPIKTFQVRKHYSPYVSDDTKALMKDRNELKELAIRTGDKAAEKEFKNRGKQIKKL